MTAPRLLAFLLPQFHRIPENDAWWGEGFTEWTNVRRARSQFPGHRQPRVPLDQRYYNLLDEDVQAWQAELAGSHGIDGFCYYHYWFEGGRRLLEKPLESILQRGRPSFPFCLAWANEAWTRTWDGGDDQILMPQSYGGREEWEAHFRYLDRVFRDPRYIRVDGRPMILIYRSASIAECGPMLQCWRELAQRHGYPGLHVVSMMTTYGSDLRDLFDARVEFEPFYSRLHMPLHLKLYEKAANAICRGSWKLFGRGWSAPRSADYRFLWEQIASRPIPPGHYPGAFVDWDNSPRKSLETSFVMRRADVDVFRRGFARLHAKATRADARFIFINAWNEWAEGTYLEPDEDRGMAYLEAIQSVVRQASSVPSAS